MKVDIRCAPAGVLVACTALAAGCTESPQELEGAWNLRHYEMGGEEQEDVSGLLVMADGRFGLIYTMRSKSGGLSGRGHAGGYTSEQDRLIFDVQWWPEEVDGAARAAPPTREVALTSRDGNMLEMRFGSGSVQRWQLVESGSHAEPAGAWQLESVEANGAQQDAGGVFVSSAGQFAFFADTAGEDGLLDVRAYGGTSRSDGDDLAVTTSWQVAFIDGEGDVSNTGEVMTLEVSGPEAALLSDKAGRTYRLRR